MDADPSLHPTDQTLSSYGLGKLEGPSAEAVNRHLEGCPDCRRRVGALSSDSFLGRLRDARRASARSTSGVPLADGTISFVPASAPAAPPPAETLPPGLAEHPDYQIKRELGRGGMGVVYLAHNTLMGRDEVLKVMGRQVMERPGVLDRFQREIRAVAQLRHPNIVTAYTAFRLAGGLVFAMEYVEGLDLSRLVKVKGPLPVGHVAYFAHQAALGLQHAHERGTVHRDIKPHNLMLTHDGALRVVKVLDFGLAKASREQKVDSGLTHEGQALGTPDYIAPEQILNATDVDIRADLYSLGGTLYFLLTGRPPFTAQSLYDIYQAHISRDADPLNLVRPEVPAELAALVAKLMAKEPHRRFQEPAEVAEALTPFFKSGKRAAPVRQPEPAPAAPRQATLVTSAVAPPPIRPTPPPASPAVPEEARPETMWSSMIDLREPEAPEDLAPAAPEPRGRRPRWFWPAVAAAAGFATVLFGVIVIITTRNGRTTVVADESQATVTVEAGDTRVTIEPTVPPDVDRSDGFVSLFNGKDLDGWGWKCGEPNAWRVENGVLVGSGPGYNGIYLKRGNLRDFHLSVYARINDGGVGGLMFRWLPTDGYKAQICNARGDNPYGRVRCRTGSLYSSERKYLVDCREPLVGPDEWFVMEVIAEGRHVVLKVNGKITADYTERGPEIADGPLYLEQIGPKTVIEFRKIEIKELNVRGPDPGRPTILAAYRAASDSPVADGALRTGEYPVGLDVDFTADSRLGALVAGLGDPGLIKTASDLSLQVHAAYTDTSLFVAVQVRDQFLDVQESDKDRPIFNDGVEIYIDGDQVANEFVGSDGGSLEGFQLVADAVGHKLTISKDFTNDAWKAATNRATDGYVVEFEIPLRLIDTQDGPGVLAAGPGSLVHFCLAVIDNDVATDRQMSYGYLRAAKSVGLPRFGGEGAWSLGIRLEPPNPRTSGADASPIGAVEGPSNALVGEPPGPPVAADAKGIKQGNPSAPPTDRKQFEILRGFGQFECKNDDLIIRRGSIDFPTIFFGDYQWTDYDFTVDAMRTGGSEGFTLIFRSPRDKKMLMFSIAGRDNRTGFVHTDQKDNRGKTEILQTYPARLLNNRWYTARVRVRGKHAQGFLYDGEKEIKLFDLEDIRYPIGRVGLQTCIADYHFKSIKVTAPDGTLLWEGAPRID